MKALSIIEQVNACLKHAQRNGQTITRFDFYPHWQDNHQVIARLPYVNRTADDLGGYPYFSVAALLAAKEVRG